ncbi:MAG: RagB/SusD family nutrient uptake outer membrane protein [Gracilimonas sp.]|uniref:RagB/SusD family nutrient uptake outer membrane protein n=1 Tax=Gracilimonas sp. TaxID=1974203 RepID=UPI00375226E1|nr:RagB/SusD family nutrient uptake outer membrane protein [Gracilimonas sp.]
MKPIKYLFLLSVVVVLFAGCDDDFLVQTNMNELNQELYWQDEGDVLQAITATYSQLQADDRWAWFEYHYVAQSYRSDLIRATRKDLPYAQRIANFTYSSDNISFGALWEDYYNGIFYANQVIENVPGMEGMDQAKKDEFVGEAKFLRGYYYLTLVTLFKNIPLVTTIPETSDDYYAAQVAPETIWTQIIEDFKEAKNTLPSSWSADFEGRATKWTAQGYLGKAYMFLERFSEAADEFEDVITQGPYDLLNTFTHNFDGSYENGVESLFEIQHTAARPNGFTESTPMYNEQAPGAMGGWEEFFPSDWLFNLMLTDTSAAGDLSGRALGTVFFDHPQSSADGVTYSSIKNELGVEKVFFKKYLYSNDISDGTLSRSGMNIHLMRYADVLLMHAEALNETDKTAQAIPFVNQVRARSGSAPIASGMNKSQLRDHLRNVERPLEFAMEYGIRWFDLARWNKDSNFSIKQTLTNHAKPDAANFQEGKHEIYPIPLSEMNKNDKLTQNPNY